MQFLKDGVWTVSTFIGKPVMAGQKVKEIIQFNFKLKTRHRKRKK